MLVELKFKDTAHSTAGQVKKKHFAGAALPVGISYDENKKTVCRIENTAVV